MFGWFGGLGPAGRRTFWACFGGFALDAMDVHLYSFVMPGLIGLWRLSTTEAGEIATAALITAVAGGWAAGLLADRMGRLATLQLTIAWFVVFTALSGLTNSFAQLLVIRGLQGLGFGGEWAVGAVLMGEVITARHRGRAVGMVQSAWAVGWGLAAILSTLVLTCLPKDYAWRALFFLGAAPGIAVILLRRIVSEPINLVHVAPQSFNTIFTGSFLRTTVVASLLATGIHGGYYAIVTWLPTYLRSERGLSILDAGGYLSVIIAGSFCGYVAHAYLSDFAGRRRTLIAFAIGCLVIVMTYTEVLVSNDAMLLLGFPLGFFATGIYGGMGPLLTELFPTEIRGSGQGFCYSFGRGLAAFLPALVGWSAAGGDLGRAIGIYAASSYVLVIITVLLLPETQGMQLQSLGASAASATRDLRSTGA